MKDSDDILLFFRLLIFFKINFFEKFSDPLKGKAKRPQPPPQFAPSEANFILPI